ncbi:MAG: hypothetical protein K6T65_15505 [Peptococcaceae bacterium]|nr:hypothetical protein [Peptococcaceae bacterium]
MIKKVNEFIGALHRNENGSYFVEMALVLIGVALAVFTAANGLANNAIVPKYNSISTEIQDVDVPDLG